VKKFDPKQVERLAKKNREASQKRYEEEAGKPAAGASKKRRREFEERPAPDPRYEGADRLHKEMKKRER
jgi:hypothetical protein